MDVLSKQLWKVACSMDLLYVGWVFEHYMSMRSDPERSGHKATQTMSGGLEVTCSSGRLLDARMIGYNSSSGEDEFTTILEVKCLITTAYLELCDTQELKTWVLQPNLQSGGTAR